MVLGTVKTMRFLYDNCRIFECQAPMLKNYKVETASGRSNLARNIEKQYYQRIDNLPAGTNQSVLIDIRGQNVSQNNLNALYNDIMERTNNGIKVRFKTN